MRADQSVRPIGYAEAGRKTFDDITNSLSYIRESAHEVMVSPLPNGKIIANFQSSIIILKLPKSISTDAHHRGSVIRNDSSCPVSLSVPNSAVWFEIPCDNGNWAPVSPA
jgi:hypothetical protein